MSGTAMTDLDRVLGEWLDDGPRRAPDRPVDAAIEHCLSHPRRPDPFGFLRSDAFAARRSSFALQPAMAFVVLGLLLVGIAAFAAGSRRDESNPVLPPPSPSAPATTPPPTPVPTSAVIHVIVPDGSGGTGPITVDIVDGSATLVTAAAGPAAEIEIPTGGVAVSNDPADDSVVRLSWVEGVPCDLPDELTIDRAARVFTLASAVCPAGDSIAIERDLVLTFSEPVPAADVTAVRR